MLMMRRAALFWPVPALLGWGGAWLAFAVVAAAAWPMPLALASGVVVAAAVALLACRGWRRRAIVVLGFPLSAAALGVAHWPAFVWLLALLPLWLAYPLRAWRDAPFFPTQRGALQAARELIALPPQARVLDAGCGLGDGLIALREAWPQAQLEGVEWSRAMAWLGAWRCRFAKVRHGDMWADDWSAFDMVYLFQRPETMARAAAKAQAQMRGGAWLVSLEFAVPGWREHARLSHPGRRTVWVYRIAGK
jgi:SAM-dependent methyltransferase